MIFVTGAGGFVGRHLVNELAKKNKIRCFDKKIDATNNNISYFYGDLKNKEEVFRAVSGCNTIIHLAMDFSDLKNNEIMTSNLVDAAFKYKVKKLIFLSADNVNSNYLGPYSKAKKNCEDIVSKFPNNVILRSTVIYGPEDQKNLAFVFDLIKKSPIIPIIGNGKNNIQPIHLNDVINFISISTKKNIKGLYTIAGKEPVSFNDLIDSIAEKMNKKIIKIHIPKFLVLSLLKLPFLKKSAVEKIIHSTEDRKYDLKNTISDFNYTPLSLKQGL